MVLMPSNRRKILFVEESSIDLDDENTPYVVILTAWEEGSSNIVFLKKLIITLLEKGAKYFACIGEFSERLHDQIDDFIYQFEESCRDGSSLGIVTTYHSNDTIEEAIDYCLYGIPYEDTKSKYILAVLDKQSKQAKIVRRFLERS